MKTIAKALTKTSAKDGYGRLYPGLGLVVGECYLVHNGVLKQMLLPQRVVESGTETTCLTYEAHQEMQIELKKYLTGFSDSDTMNM